MMIYCMDTSALICLGERHYPERIKVFEPIWDFVYDGVDRGDIISVDAVLSELQAKAADWRDVFITKANNMFLINEDIEAEYAAVIGDIESDVSFPINKHRTRFLKGADPWVIALARSVADEVVVVTSEKKELNAYGMRAVCNALNLNSMDLIELFETNNIGMK